MALSDFNCDHCKITFKAERKTIAIRLKRNIKGRFCSRRCRDAAGITLVSMQCYTCEGKIRVKPSTIRKNKSGHFFCSIPCRNKNNNFRPVGPAHALYQNGSSTYRRRIKDRCEGCAIRFPLVVHHKDGDRKNNKDSNLKTLCLNCHGIHHARFSNGKWIVDTKYLSSEEEMEAARKFFLGA